MRIVGQNKNIQNTLKELFLENYNLIKNLDYKTYVSELIEDNPIVFERNTGEQMFLNDEFEIIELKNSLKNFRFVSTFNNAVKLEIDEEEIKSDFKKNLFKILSALKAETLSKHPNIKQQSLFITHVDYPKSYLNCYGEGNYPILKEPEYFEYDFSEELISTDYTIDYSKIWKNLVDLETQIDENDLFNQINDTDKYNALIKAYVYKTYMLLFEVFQENEKELFEGFPIKKPFYIFGNEFDCEPINLYLIE